MKKLYFLFFFCFGILVHAQIINIPDVNFKNKLLQASSTADIAYNSADVRIKIDTNNNGDIEVNEALLVHKLNVSNSTIASLTGIESFTSLRHLSCGANQLTSLNTSTLTNLNSLSCINNQITSLNLQNNLNLNYFECYNNLITSLDVSNSVNLLTLSCESNLITNLNISNCMLLTDLYCGHNQLTTLDVSNRPNLEYLGCQQNLLTSLNVANDTALISLQINVNQLQNINLDTLVNLEMLSMGENPYTSVVNLSALTNLTQLFIENMDSTAVFPLTDTVMPSLVNLVTLKVDGSDIGNLNYYLLPNVTMILCRNTGLTTITTMPTDLENLVVQSNLLTSLDLTPFTNLKAINFGANPVNNLIFGNHPDLLSIAASFSNLTSMDFSNLPALNTISISSNSLLTNVNLKNGISGFLLISGCPNLQYICADEGEINSIQNSITTYGYTNCHVNTYCNFAPGGTFYTIQGSNKYDFNSNGCDSNDINASNLKLNLTSGSVLGSVFGNFTGSYNVPVQAGTHVITPQLENPTYFTIAPTSSSVTFPSTASPFNQDFCLTPNGTHNDLEIIIIPINTAQPGFDARYKVIYKNKGTQSQSGNLSLTFDDAVMDFISASTTPSSQAVNSLTWSFNNLQPFESRVITLVMNLNSPIENPPLNGGSILNYSASINGATDGTPIDNTASFSQEVLNSFDPNDKTCLEGTTITPDKVGEYVHYIIRFENTGTANAQNIVVKDIIDTTKYDMATLIPLDGSHNFYTRITNTNQVEFIFENIQLPFDDDNNDGYVAFKIKTKSNLTVGSSFSNTANIYFDYNFPIVTNTATTTIQALGNSDFEFAEYFTLSPVPTKDVLHFDTNQSILVSSISIYNTLGQLILVETNPSNQIDVSNLKTGNYFIKVTSDKGTSVGKFIKQ